MSSTTSFSPTPQVQFHLQWRTPQIQTKLQKHTSSVFPLFSSPTNHSHSFKSIHTSHPLTPKVQSLPLALTESSLDVNTLGVNTLDVNTLEDSINLHTPLLPHDTIRRILVQDPQWMMPSVAFRSLHVRSKEKAKSNCEGVERSKFNLLRRRQIRSETEAWERTVEEYREMEKEMRERNQAPNLPYVKSLFLGWFEPLREAIAKQKKSTKSKRMKSVLSSNIELLPADKMAIIVMHKMMGLLMTGTEDGCVSVVQAAMQIGYAIEQEVRIHNYLQRNKNSQKKKIIIGDHDDLVKEKEIARRRVKNLIRRKRFTEVQKLLKNEEASSWDRNTLAKLGSHLIELLVETAYVHAPVNQDADAPPDIRPAFRHTFRTSSGGSGQKFPKKYGVIEGDSLVLEGLDRSARHMLISYVPMLIPPKKWKGYDKGGYLFLPSYVMRTHGSKKQEEVLRSVPEKTMHKVFEALDALGGTKWRINRKLLSIVENLWDSGGNVAGLVDRADVPLPPKPPLSEDPSEIQKWRWDVRKAKKINQERHSLRCDTEIKLSVAQKMKDEEGFYYPHNLDFRGRAYPMHPHLNHLSSDLCRGVLEFSEGRPLGKSGLHWLKIHLANLYGGAIKKLPHEGRLAFVDDHLLDIFDSSDNPVNGTRWWLTAEDPFQCLAACINLSEALRSSSPITVISHLPIHQDGSCNGLQHYAALGRDSLEAAAVNLVAGDKPADVYTEIAARVHNIMKNDSGKGPSTDSNALLATILIDQVDRKLVKQTVMTSVYGVTYIGAREQIKRRLEEKGHITDDRLRFSASCYAAKVTMKALGELFQAARRIMSWLGDCAKVITSENHHVRWSTPLGLPVLQPYSKSQRHLVRTSLQVLALKRESDMVNGRKQRSAFPPNYVHSLDGSHMMMTAVACKNAGLNFAGVHDSFWTHACDVDRMNRILREKFVELYSSPILEELLESFQKTYPNLTFPPLPPRGDFDLEEVLESPYFFN